MNLGTLLMLLEEQKRNSPQGDSTEVKFVVRKHFLIGDNGNGITGLGHFDIEPGKFGIRNDIAEIGNDADTGAVRLMIE